jgi:hypothetical protein
MKKGLPTALLFVCYYFVFSQSNFRFADSGSVWNVIDEPFSCLGPPGAICYQTFTTVYQSDTLISGKWYQNLSDNYLREDSLQRVYSFVGDSDYLIYDFGKVAGDTINEKAANEPLTIFVDSVDTVFIVHPRKRMFVKYSGYLNDIWIDGIGSLYTNFLYPGGSALLADVGIDSLLCYSVNNELFYQLPDYHVCSVDTVIWADVNEISANNSLSLSPVPAFNQLNINSAGVPIISIALYSIAGTLVKQIKQAVSTSISINISSFSPGVYIAQVQTEEGLSICKWIKM